MVYDTGEVSPHDLVGIGFGPANLSLAVALEEAEESGMAPISRLFLEARPGPAWHPNMMLEGSLLQITALKDLITVVDPRSRFTFLNYLKEKDRLYEFLNLRDLFPTRLEFNDYLGWAARQVSHHVRYGKRVLAIEPVMEGSDTVSSLTIRVHDEATGRDESYRARNLVLAVGGTPALPPGVELPASGRAFHSQGFLRDLEARFPDHEAPYRFVVIGSGQSGAEIFDYLMRRYPKADVTAAIRRFAYKPVDESHFTNEIFFPPNVDLQFELGPEERARFVDMLRDVNYAVVDHALIAKIYRRIYDERVAGLDRARLRPFLELEGLDDVDAAVRCRFRDVMRDQPVEIEADGVVLSTGYRWQKEHPLLEGLAPFFEVEETGGYRVERDYRLATQPGFQPQIHLQGYCEQSHGISETVLSLLPVRAQDILTSVRVALAGQQPTPVGLHEAG